MKNYQDFNLEDFLLDDSFIRWVNQESAPPEQQFWQDWIDQHPEKSEVIEQARLILSSLGVAENRPISEAEIDRQARLIRLRIDQQRPLRNPFSGWARAAAVLMLVSGLGWAAWLAQGHFRKTAYTQLTDTAPTSLIEKVNLSNTPLSIRLSDSSLVQLQPASRISFPERFTGAKREVYLTGEAFFNVRKNPEQPFYVHASDVVTKVLGTSFTVRAYDNQASVQVLVRSGQVSVFARNDWQRAEKEVNSEVPGVVLIPNQQVVFNREEHQFHRTLTPDPVIVDQRFSGDAFVYDETPVTQIFNQLETAYGVDIVFDEQLLSHCTVTARLQDEPLLEKLNLICQTIKASYQIVDAQIIISSRGCS